MVVSLFYLQWVHLFFLCPFRIKKNYVVPILSVLQFPAIFSCKSLTVRSSKCPDAWLFFFCHLAGEITSGRHERKKTMMGSHFRLESISSKELSLWQSCLLQRLVRTWWIPAGSKSVCKSFFLKILIISPKSKSLIMTSQRIVAVKHPHEITMQFTVMCNIKHILKPNAGVNSTIQFALRIFISGTRSLNTSFLKNGIYSRGKKY